MRARLMVGGGLLLVACALACPASAEDASGVAQCLRAEGAKFPSVPPDTVTILRRARRYPIVATRRFDDAVVVVWERHGRGVYLVWTGHHQTADAHRLRRDAQRAVRSNHFQVLLIDGARRPNRICLH